MTCDTAIAEAALAARRAVSMAKSELKTLNSRKKHLEKVIKTLTPASRLAPSDLAMKLMVGGFEEGSLKQNRVALVKEYRVSSGSGLKEAVYHFRDNASNGKMAEFTSSKNATHLRELAKTIQGWGFQTEIRVE